MMSAHKTAASTIRFGQRAQVDPRELDDLKEQDDPRERDDQRVGVGLML
jgi:hypothetical protein